METKMKCVKLPTNDIVRMPDLAAIKLVKEGKGTYAPKADWKAAGRKRQA